jgi:Putative zinc-finger
MSHLTCDDVEALLPLVADGTLDEAGDPAVFQHLADCERCQQSLVSHDLIALSLTRMVQAPAPAPAPQILRPRWPRFLPAAAAAGLLIAGGWWALTAHTPVQAASVPTVAAVTPAPVVPLPTASASHVRSQPAPVEVEIEVVALPGSTTAHPHYLVRRGEQVLLVAPAGVQAEAPNDARPASYSPNRY